MKSPEDGHPFSRPTSRLERFDGIVCLGGGDWWYHNRGHYDVQMIRHLRLLLDLPVLYVNSLGVRIPRPHEGLMFLRRIKRKVKSWARGLQFLEPGFAVYSPVGLPGRLGMAASSPAIAIQIGAATRKLTISRPLVWVECPSGVEVAERLDHSGLLYQRTDFWEAFPNCDAQLLRDYDRRLKASADLVLYASHHLYERERDATPAARFLDHGVDYERFAGAAHLQGVEPPDLQGILRPRIGFIGGLDEHTFDTRLLCDVAGRLPDHHFVLVGSSSLRPGWCTLANVYQLGQKAYEQVATYMGACDVLIMPWLHNEWIRGCNPVKLKEYLAVGRPVVSTYFPELDRFADHVLVATSAEQFATAIQSALQLRGMEATRRARVRNETWTARAEQLVHLLRDVGLSFERRAS